MKVLVLFCGTGSIERVFNDHECRGVDIVPKYNPYYLVDILKWDYKTDLKDFVPDYIHASPVCKEFSKLKNTLVRDVGLGTSLFNKSVEIIKYIQQINPNLVFTIENPKNKFFVKLVNECGLDCKIYTTSYCKYGFNYQKDSVFVSNTKLCLKKVCGRKCFNFKKYGCHSVRIGVSGTSTTHVLSNEHQVPDSVYYKYIRDDIMNTEDRIRIYNSTSMRYRIPTLLIEDIKWSIENKEYLN